MLSRIPPGLPHVLRILARLCIPILVVYVFAYFVNVPTWAFVLLEILSVPAYVTGHIRNKSYREHRAAARFGAVLPPRYNGESFGNIDLLQKFQKIYKHGYLGQYSPESGNCGVEIDCYYAQATV